MNRTEKQAVVAELTETLKNNNFVYLADTTGLSANDTNKFRRMLFENGVEMRMAKNTLIELAMNESGKDFEELKAALIGSTCMLVSANQKAPAQSIKAFRAKSDKPLLKGAWIDNSVFLGDSQLTALVDLKSKEDLVADIIALLQSPIKTVIGGLQASGGQKIAGIVKTLSDR
jgi:large subunit ribosomal protein L10